MRVRWTIGMFVVKRCLYRSALLSKTPFISQHPKHALASIREIVVSSLHANKKNHNEDDDNDLAAEKQNNKNNQIRQKAAKWETRIAALEMMDDKDRTETQEKELLGLRETSRRFEEQFDPSIFTVEHRAFKAAHNQAFGALISYCDTEEMPVNVFYLDGPDGQTTLALVQNDNNNVNNESNNPSPKLDPTRCFVANRHESSCSSLRQHLPDANVFYQSATAALVEHGPNKQFGAFYLDGCGGYAPQVMEMAAAALAGATRQRIVLGFSLVGGNRDVVNKEVQVIQQITSAAGTRYRCEHVLDNPLKYGVPVSLKKLEGSTLTTWLLLERQAP